MRRHKSEDGPRGSARRGSAASAGSPAGSAAGSAAPGAAPSQPVEGATRRLAELTHELSGLIDGSMRTVNLVLSARERPDEITRQSQDLDRRLRTVRAALEQMAGMVQAAIRDGSAAAPRRRPALAPLTLADAVEHAVAIHEPLAVEHAAKVLVSVDPSARGLPAGPMYTLVVNGVRNALESLSRRVDTPDQAADPAQPTPPARQVEIDVRLSPLGDGGRRQVLVTISDTGVGPPVPQRTVRGRPFQPGFSTKPGGAGLGLALCRDLLMQFAGAVELSPRDDGPGAILRARYPAPPEPLSRG